VPSLPEELSFVLQKQTRTASKNASQPPRHAWAVRHDVQFYRSDEFLCGSVASFLAEGIREGQPLVVIATEAHRSAFLNRLGAMGVQLEALVGNRDVAWLDADQTLASFMDGAFPERDRFFRTMESTLDALIAGRRYVVVRAFGEMVDLLCRADNVEGAIILEQLWNELAQKYSFSLLCAYADRNVFIERHTNGFNLICQQHGCVLEASA
jgi:DcmR-like sensory protein